MVTRKLKRVFVLIAMISVVGAITMCGPDRSFIGETGKSKGIESRGIWTFNSGESGNSQTGRVEITDDGTFDFFVQYMGEKHVIKGTIEKFDNDTYNDGTSGEGDFGYAIVKIHSGKISLKDSSAIGSFVVVRWKNITPGVEMTFAISKGSDVFDHRPTAEEAENELVTDDNYRDWLVSKCIDPLTPPDEPQAPIEIEGTWKSRNKKYTITVSGDALSVVYGQDNEDMYSGEIVKYNNYVWTDSQAYGDCGYAVVKLKTGQYVEGGYEGKFAVFGWYDMAGSRADLVMSNNGFTIACKDTVEEAEEITSFVETLGHFYFKRAKNLDCEEPQEDIEVKGTWTKKRLLEKQYTIEISNTNLSVVYGDDRDDMYSGEIVKYDNSTWTNGSEKGDCGYAIVKLESGLYVEGGYEGKYAVFTWRGLDESKSKGSFIISNNGSTIKCVDTVEEAEEITSFLESILWFYFTDAEKQ